MLTVSSFDNRLIEANYFINRNYNSKSNVNILYYKTLLERCYFSILCRLSALLV